MAISYTSIFHLPDGFSDVSFIYAGHTIKGNNDFFPAPRRLFYSLSSLILLLDLFAIENIWRDYSILEAYHLLPKFLEGQQCRVHH